LEKERADLKKNNIRLAHSGRDDRLTPELRKILKEVTTETAGNDGYTLHLALDYGGKDEIVRAVRRLGDEEVTEESIREHLDQPELPDIDLVIRTSGEQRTSNFCLWQSAYAEWMFIEKHFPEFTGTDLAKALDAFGDRKRRFGS
jgi:undecaprenyl diphosphate synthase